jgi:hypothetical protein
LWRRVKAAPHARLIAPRTSLPQNAPRANAFERLGAGAVHLSAIKLLAPVLTEANHASLLDRARGKSKRQIELIVAELLPKADVPARLRKLPDAWAALASRAASSSLPLMQQSLDAHACWLRPGLLRLRRVIPQPFAAAGAWLVT